MFHGLSMELEKSFARNGHRAVGLQQRGSLGLVRTTWELNADPLKLMNHILKNVDKELPVRLL